MTPERLESVKRRYAEKQTAKEGLTSDVVNGPALARLQMYAVIAAVSADDVPPLVAEVERLQAALAAAAQSESKLGHCVKCDTENLACLNMIVGSGVACCGSCRLNDTHMVVPS